MGKSKEKFLQSAVAQSYLYSFEKNVAKNREHPFTKEEQIAFLLYKKGWNLLKGIQPNSAKFIHVELLKIKYWKMLFSYIELYYPKDNDLLSMAIQLREGTIHLMEYYNDELLLKCLQDFQTVLLPFKKIVWRIQNYINEPESTFLKGYKIGTDFFPPPKKPKIPAFQLLQMLKEALEKDPKYDLETIHHLEAIEDILYKNETQSHKIKSPAKSIESKENIHEIPDKITADTVDRQEFEKIEETLTRSETNCRSDENHYRDKNPATEKSATVKEPQFEEFLESEPDFVLVDSVSNSDSSISYDSSIGTENEKEFQPSDTESKNSDENFASIQEIIQPDGEVITDNGFFAGPKNEHETSENGGESPTSSESSQNTNNYSNSDDFAQSASEVKYQSENPDIIPPLSISILDDLESIIFNISNTLFVKNSKEFRKQINILDDFVRTIQDFGETLENQTVIQGGDLDFFVVNILLDNFCAPFLDSLDPALRYFGYEELSSILFPFYDVLSRFHIHPIMSDPKNPFLPKHPRLYKIEQVVTLNEGNFRQLIEKMSPRSFDFDEIPDEFVEITHTGLIYKKEIRIPARATLFTKSESSRK